MVTLHLKNSAQASDTFWGTCPTTALLCITATASVRILGVCPFLHAVQFFPCSWVPNTFEHLVALNTAVDLKSLHSQFRRASVRHALKLKALRLRHKHSSKSPNLNFANIKIQPFFRHFAKFNARQIFPLYGNPSVHNTTGTNSIKLVTYKLAS